MLVSALTKSLVYPESCPWQWPSEDTREDRIWLDCSPLSSDLHFRDWLNLWYFLYSVPPVRLLLYEFMWSLECPWCLGSYNVQWQRVLQLHYILYRASHTCFFKPARGWLCLLPLLPLGEGTRNNWSLFTLLCASEGFVSPHHISAWRLLIHWVTLHTKAVLLYLFLLLFSESPLPLLLCCFWAVEPSCVW